MESAIAGIRYFKNHGSLTAYRPCFDPHLKIHDLLSRRRDGGAISARDSRNRPITAVSRRLALEKSYGRHKSGAGTELRTLKIWNRVRWFITDICVLTISIGVLQLRSTKFSTELQWRRESYSSNVFGGDKSSVELVVRTSAGPNNFSAKVTDKFVGRGWLGLTNHSKGTVWKTITQHRGHGNRRHLQNCKYMYTFITWDSLGTGKKKSL